MSKSLQLIDGKVESVKVYAFGDSDKKEHIALVTIDNKTFEIGHFDPSSMEPEDKVIVVGKRNKFGLYACLGIYNLSKQTFKHSHFYIHFIFGIISTFLGGLFSLWAWQEIQAFGIKKSIPEIILPLVFIPLGVILLINGYQHIQARMLLRMHASKKD